MAGLANRNWWSATLAGTEIEALVGTGPENVAFLSRFHSPSRQLVPRTQIYAVARADYPGEAVVVCPVGDLDVEIQRPLEGNEYRPYGAFFIERGHRGDAQALIARYDELTSRTAESAFDALVATLDEKAPHGRIAVDEHGIDQAILAKLTDRYGDRIVAGSQLFARLRSVKSPEEIQLLAEAVSATEAGYEAALAAAAPGITEAEMARVLDAATIAAGGVPVFTFIGFGEGSAYPNALPRADRALGHGDVIRFDIGCQVGGYHSDIARTAVLGEPSREVRTYYSAILEGEERGLECVRSGVPARRVFEEAVRGTREGGIPHYKRTHVGHGIGLQIYDIPILNAIGDEVLQAGMVLEVETPYYDLGFAGVQVEDTIVVTDDGYRLLTRTDRDLAIVEA